MEEKFNRVNNQLKQEGFFLKVKEKRSVYYIYHFVFSFLQLPFYFKTLK